MNIIKPSADTLSKILTPYQLVERVGRTCYKSEDAITDTSAETFIKGLMTRKHFAMLEHSNVIIQCTKDFYRAVRQECDTTYLHMTEDNFSFVISGSFRAWRDLIMKYYDESVFSDLSPVAYLLWVLNNEYPLIFKDLVETIWGDTAPCLYNNSIQYLRIIGEDAVKSLYGDNTDLIMEHIIHTVHFVCDRGVSHEFVRHRNCGFAQESTRYCNYSKDKFGNEITVIEPFFFSGDSHTYWLQSCEFAEDRYFSLIKEGAKPQEARSVLPNSLKTELIITCNEKEWQHIVNLRYRGTTGAPHPQMKEVMGLIVPTLSVESEGRICYE